MGERPYTIRITRKETIYVLRQLAFLVILPSHIKKLFGDIDLIFAIRNFKRPFITMVRYSSVGESLCLNSDLLA
jgi:hypothetical protein